MTKRRAQTISDVARMGGKARMAELDKKGRAALAKKGGLANADRLARLAKMEANLKDALRQKNAK